MLSVVGQRKFIARKVNLNFDLNMALASDLFSVGLCAISHILFAHFERTGDIIHTLIIISLYN